MDLKTATSHSLEVGIRLNVLMVHAERKKKAPVTCLCVEGTLAAHYLVFFT